MSRLTTLWQAVGNDLMFEVEVIDPKDNQGDIQEEDGKIKAKVLRIESATSCIQRIPSPSPPKATPKLKYSHMVGTTL